MKTPSVLASLAALALFGSFAGNAFASAPALKPASYEVGGEATANFEAVGSPSLLKIHGHGATLSGMLSLEGAQAKGDFELDLEKFATGISLRDRHMKEKYLETGKFPKARLQVESVELPSGFAPGASVTGAKFRGQLTLKGVTKPVSGTLDVNGQEMATTAAFSFALSDYPVGVPSYMGITVADKIAVKAAIPEFKKKEL